MSKQSRTPKQNAMGRWCALRGCQAGAYLGNTSQPVPLLARHPFSLEGGRGASSHCTRARRRPWPFWLALLGRHITPPTPRWIHRASPVPGMKLGGPVVFDEANMTLVYSFSKYFLSNYYGPDPVHHGRSGSRPLSDGMQAALLKAGAASCGARTLSRGAEMLR